MKSGSSEDPTVVPVQPSSPLDTHHLGYGSLYKVLRSFPTKEGKDFTVLLSYWDYVRQPV